MSESFKTFVIYSRRDFSHGEWEVILFLATGTIETGVDPRDLPPSFINAGPDNDTRTVWDSKCCFYK